jgi:putative transposase
MVRRAEDWDWSSYRETAGLCTEYPRLTTNCVLSTFGNSTPIAIRRYKKFVAEGADQPFPLTCLKNEIFLGSNEFVEETQRHLSPDQSLSDIPKSQKEPVKKPLSYYETEGNTRNESMAKAYLSGYYTLAEIGAHFGVSYVTVSRAVKCLECKM